MCSWNAEDDITFIDTSNIIILIKPRFQVVIFIFTIRNYEVESAKMLSLKFLIKWIIGNIQENVFGIKTPYGD